MKLWLIITLFSLVVFIFGLLSSKKAERYISNHRMLEGNPSIIRKKATIRMIVAYILLFVAFIIYFFWY